MLSPENWTFLVMVTGLKARLEWSLNRATFLATVDVNVVPNHIEGLDPTRPARTGQSDLQTSLEEVERILAVCEAAAETAPAIGVSEYLGDHKTGAQLGIACARLLRWIHIGDGDAAKMQTAARAAEAAYMEAGDRRAASWASFISDMICVICEDDTDSRERGTALGRRIGDPQGLGEAAANVCLRLACRLRIRAAGLQASGDFGRVSRLGMYGVALCEALPNNVILAQMHAFNGRLMADVKRMATAAANFQRAYTYAIAERDQKLPAPAFYPVLDEIFKGLTEANDRAGMKRFRNILTCTWASRFQAEGEYQLWEWETKIDLRQKLRSNRFREAQQDVAKIFQKPLHHPYGSREWLMELYFRTNLGMNYGQIDLAREATEELDREPHNFFSAIGQWERSPEAARVAFEACVERTAFVNSLRYLEHLKSFPEVLNLSPEPGEHDLGDYQHLVHVARIYIFQEKWAEALALLKCSCSLVTEQRRNLASDELRQSQYGSSEAEKVLDWTVWVCLHFHSQDNISTSPKALDKNAVYDSWAEEAIRYAEMGKARGIGDALRKQPEFLRSNPEIGLVGDGDLLRHLSAWLDSETLVIHLTLVHEDCGIICLDTSGIRFAQWFTGAPGFGAWEVMSLTSDIFGTIESPKMANHLRDPDPKVDKRLKGAIKKLSTALISPISHLLRPTSSRPRRLCFIPAGHLTRVPFAALELDRSPLIDNFAVHQAPSLAVLKMLSQSARQRQLETPDPASIAVVAAHDTESPLLANAVECFNAAAQFSRHGQLVSAAALDKAGMLELLARHDLIHLGAHGSMDYERPLESSIHLGGGGGCDLTVANLRGARTRATLVFFSACLVALGHSSLTDDMTGFQTAVLTSGALAFAGSLWSAHAVAALFFAHFLYQELLLSGSPLSGSGSEAPVTAAGRRSLVDAFAEAQRRLRGLDRRTAGEIIGEMQKRWESRGALGQEVPNDMGSAVVEFFEQYKNYLRDDFASFYFWAPFVLIGHSSPLSMVR